MLSDMAFSLLNGLYAGGQKLAEPLPASVLSRVAGTPVTADQIAMRMAMGSAYQGLPQTDQQQATVELTQPLPTPLESQPDTTSIGSVAGYSGPHAATLAAAEQALRSKESSSTATAQNQVSSAGGLFQFINPTWDEKMQQLGVPIAATDAERNQQKYTPELNTRAFRLTNTEYAAALDKADLPVTVQTIEAIHRLGVTGGLQAIHTALNDPSAPLVGSGLSPGAVRGNEDVARLTVGEFLANPYPQQRGLGVAMTKPDLTSISTASGARFTVDKNAAARFSGLLTDLEDAGYKIDPATSGGYNPRNIAGTNIPSQHAFGRAIDINWSRNPQGTSGQSDLPETVPELAAKWGITWGGEWHGARRDPMHFEISNP